MNIERPTRHRRASTCPPPDRMLNERQKQEQESHYRDFGNPEMVRIYSACTTNQIIKKPELLNDILQETEELIKISVTSIKTAEKTEIAVECSVFGICFDSALDVRCSTFIS